jgi:hypothetical protein
MDYKGIDTLGYLIEMVEGIKKDIVELTSRIDLKTYTLKEIAVSQGCSVSNLRNKPWKMPNYGRPDVGQHPGRWFYLTIMNWYSAPEDERRFKWESMTSRERQKALGIIRDTKIINLDREAGFHITENRSAKAG